MIDEKMCRTAPTRIQRSVRFAEMSELAIIEPSTVEELDEKWYSKQEYANMKHRYHTDAYLMWKKLSTTPVESVGKDDLFSCVGMEKFLSSDIWRHTQERRISHIRNIRAVQSRQRMLNLRSDEHLSLLSQQSSEWTVTRAQNLAQLYWDTLKE